MKAHQPLLLKKWKIVGSALQNRLLSAGDVAILWYLCERFDKTKGYAWPGYNRMRSDMNMSASTAKRSVKRLEELRYITVIERGFRSAKGSIGKSNRYVINWNLIEASVTNETSGVDKTSTNEDTDSTEELRLVSSTIESSSAIDTAPVSYPTPESTYYSGDTSVINRSKISGSGDNQMRISFTGDDALKCASPYESHLIKENSNSIFEERKLRRKQKETNELLRNFWNLYPKPMTSKTAVEKVLIHILSTEKVKDHLFDSLQAFAKTYKYKRMTAELKNQFFQDKYIVSPLKFLTDRRWEDAWHSQSRAAEKEYYAEIAKQENKKIHSSKKQATAILRKKQNEPLK